MKRFIAGVFLIVGAATAGASDLSDAAKALNGKDYRQALALYTQLAHAGNPEAELRLGEMYWYGEGAPLDREKGDALFARAAAAGHPGAVAATRLTGQRQQHLADISYWTTGYDGADLVAGEFNCVQPKVPDVSRTKREIGKVSAEFEAYRACYNGFIGNLESALPPARRIPEDVVLVMSEQELGQARQHLGKVYAEVAAHGKQSAAQVMASREVWMAQTSAFLTTESNRWEQRMADMDRDRRDHAMRLDWTHNVPAARAVTITK